MLWKSSSKFAILTPPCKQEEWQLSSIQALCWSTYMQSTAKTCDASLSINKRQRNGNWRWYMFWLAVEQTAKYYCQFRSTDVIKPENLVWHRNFHVIPQIITSIRGRKEKNLNGKQFSKYQQIMLCLKNSETRQNNTDKYCFSKKIKDLSRPF